MPGILDRIANPPPAPPPAPPPPQRKARLSAGLLFGAASSFALAGVIAAADFRWSGMATRSASVVIISHLSLGMWLALIGMLCDIIDV